MSTQHIQIKPTKKEQFFIVLLMKRRSSDWISKVHYCRFENLTICSCSCKNNTLKISHF